jgi:outer membrane beta-barrel protein
MKKTRIGLLMAAALCVLPATASAQKKKGVGVEAKGEAKADAKAAAGEGAAAEGEAAAEGAATPGPGAEGAAEGAAAGEETGVADEGAGTEGLDEICKLDPAACPTLDMKKEAARPLNEQIYAVQQLFALRVRRFELNPYWGVTLNDQFVSHNAPGLSINYYITNVLAIGVNGNYYQPFNVDRDFNADVRRAARVGVPLTEYQWSAALNFTYVPAYGKFAGFGDFIFHYDAYVVGGVGALSSRPIPVIDPDERNFDWQPKLAFNAGVGLRIFFNRWFAAMLEVRDYVFNDELEALSVNEENPADKGTWYGEKKITNNVQAQLGVSIFIPFSFDYRLPK